jgi:hypothetical protein
MRRATRLIKDLEKVTAKEELEILFVTEEEWERMNPLPDEKGLRIVFIGGDGVEIP